MARKKRVMQAAPEKRMVPEDTVMRRLAQLPDDVKRMVLGFGYGLLIQKSREEAQAGRQADRA